MVQYGYIYYYYDESGVCGMNYNGTEYFYRKNILGDVIAIYDTDGNRVCSYFYDAWGKHSIEGDQTIGNLNPFRYRGYYYDEEFGLYYLQSRYYDSEIGRFISADDVSYLAPEDIFGLNLYAYCNDNPVMYVDPSGTTAWWEWCLLGVATVVVIGAAVVATVATGGVAAVAGGMAIGGALGCLTSIVGQGTTNGWDNISVGGIAMGALIGSALGGLGGAAFGGAGAGAGALALAGGGSVSTGTVVAGVAGIGLLGLNVLLAHRTGKEGSTDKPSWVNREMIDFKKSPQQNATDLLNHKYGMGNWKKGPGSEFSKIFKWVARFLFYKG